MNATLTTDEPVDDSEFAVPADLFDRLARHQWRIQKTTAGNEVFTFLPTGGTMSLESAIVRLRAGGRIE